MSANDQIDRQTELLWRIARTTENLQKLGEAKITYGQVKSRLDALESNWVKFQTNHDQLVKIREASDEKERAALEQRSYFAKDFFGQCEEKYLDSRGSMIDRIESLKPVAAPNASLVETSQASAARPTPRRLPPIALPTFSGSYSEWKPFHDLFTSIVRENEHLSEVEKLHYLKTSVNGEPSQLIRNIAVTESNFSRAWETLVSRYENKRLLTDSHLAKLFAIPRISKKSSAEIRRLHNDTCEALGALEALCSPELTWDHMIVHMTIRKLDPASLEEWEKRVSEKLEFPTFSELEAFLLGRTHALEAVEHAQGPSAPSKHRQPPGKPSSYYTKSHVAVSKESSCSFCKGAHYIASCKPFQSKSLEQRKEFVSSHSLCFNCLGPHPVKDCRSPKRCRTCDNRHHTLLHRSSSSPTASTSNPENSHGQAPAGLPPQPAASTSTQVSSHTAQSNTVQRLPVLLATARVLVSNPETGESLTARVLLDQGSESSFISESLAQQLRLTRRHASIPVIGVGAQQSGMTRGRSTIKIQSRVNPSFSCRVEPFILPRVTSFLPSFRVLVEDWPHLQGLTLADPRFAEPGQIDVILGADVYGHVLIQGICRGAPGSPVAQETQFGWVLSGPVSSEAACFSHNAVQGLQCSLDQDLLDLVQRFWAQEEVCTPLSLTAEEEQCEQHFRNTVSRDATGRYIVRLPVRDNSVNLGNSRIPAQQMLLRMEKRFAGDSQLKAAYSDFLREYRDLGHMRRAPSATNDSRAFYLPHHGVVRESSSTTKLRVVFNGSQKTQTGVSLNDNLYVGPKVQTDLADVLSRWRQYPVAFSADIAKMYRQILVHGDDWDLQRILWREDPQLPIEEYQLCTVTYGLASAPYLAIRVLHQLVQDEGNQYPLAQRVMIDNTYVDDVLSGAENPLQAREKIRELNQLLKAGGFELKKWTSSHPAALADIAPGDREIAKQQNFDQSPFFRALGLAWRPDLDSFAFAPQHPKDEHIFTKRKVLSETAQLFDPLGWLSPITIKAKIFMQTLWAHGLGWDEPIPEPLALRWNIFRQELRDVALITIPRWIGFSSKSPAVEIHGFADASQEAIAAVLYVRTYIDTHEVRVSLVCSKTKVAPLKKVTIPRLELCAALLLVRLVRQMEKTLALETAPVHLWTDSTVALAWIKSHPSRWKDFVRNRVTEIQELVRARWRHISGTENPADLASRGASPAEVRASQLWTRGPSWLLKPSVSWPSSSPTLNGDEPPEEKKQTVAHHLVAPNPPPIWDLVDRYSSLTKLARITALCRRAVRALRAKPRADEGSEKSLRGSITTAELEDARIFWVKATQTAYFNAEIKLITEGVKLTQRYSLSRLAPFVDQKGLLRVGGRLQHASLSYDEKHPVILPRESSLTTLVIDHQHRTTLHGGPQLTLATIRQRYWIIGGRVPVRSFIHRCVPCARHRAALSTQQMGQLPQTRVSRARPFLHSGVDYAGPFSIRASRGKNPKTYKGYIAVFVCFSTSAVHLELVSDCTTEAFLAAYKRFISRRGICATLASDCGKNLVGADAELRRLLAASSKDSAHIATILASHGTQWRFNPPSAPDFGGKWEAGVKSVKFHLKRVIGESKLTFEQFETFLAQVEATLNSRPLCAISDDPTDSGALTPGHFLIGTALNTVPEPSLAGVPAQRLSHWQHSRQMLEHFWSRWSTEYLQTFQHLPKWQSINGNIPIGAIVLIKDENLPPSVWPLARVVDVHPGADGLVRVVTVKTKSSVLKRPIVKLCVLPVNSQTEPLTAGGAS